MKSLEEIKVEVMTEWLMKHCVPTSKYIGIHASAMAKNLVDALDEAEITYWDKRAIAMEETMAYEGGLDANNS